MPQQPKPGSRPARGVLASSIRGQSALVTTSTVFYILHQGAEASVPLLIGVIIDEAVTTGSVSALARWLLILAAVFLGLALSFRYGARAGERASYQAAHRLRMRLTSRVVDQHGGAEAGRLSGALVNIATNDAKRVGAVNLALPLGVAGLAGILVAGTVLLRISTPLGLLVLLGTPLLLVLAHLLGKPLERRSGAEQERAAHASGVAADLVSGLRVLKGIGAVSTAVARYRATSRNSLAATVRAARAEAWHDGAILILTGVLIALIALVGGQLAINAEITIGNLVTAVGLAQFLLGPLQIFAVVNGQLAQGRASAKRIGEVLAATPAVHAGEEPLPSTIRGELRLRGLRLDPLHDVDLSVPAGHTLGIVATDARAATALLDCLGRAAEPTAGSVSLDGIDVSTVAPSRLREALVVAAHDADLFEESLLDNVTAATPELSEDAVAAALRASGGDEVAETLPAGAHTVLAERGRSLSGGQRQRVALARALAGDPPVLVLHEPTTAVDAVTEARIAEGIRELRTGRTTVLVTTSPTLLKITDTVVFVAGAAVQAEDTHSRLLRADDQYRSAVLG
ncbi:putative ABC transport system ATP-binding protein [Tamaricihabitans halophyticus]|uniref:Putative ABC transport system ATP-binding protein n=1 Tax=Tamaricihabitans halophyticus TaxID=1262583 RepID=A0A4R2QXB3_9PSEU|nr:ABC transporter ATP-binding protein [Tamaricihabitans halophyticus]TCP53628.1 putative ABC transport system ATP-binding protein [Tamaricihabitans halophyticus]